MNAVFSGSREHPLGDVVRADINEDQTLHLILEHEGKGKTGISFNHEETHIIVMGILGYVEKELPDMVISSNSEESEACDE